MKCPFILPKSLSVYSKIASRVSGLALEVNSFFINLKVLGYLPRQKLRPESVNVVFMDNNIEKNSFSFLIKNRNHICIPNINNTSKSDSFMDLFYNKSIFYIDKELKPKYQKLINEKKESYEKISGKSNVKKKD